jgi:hypothetical protein
MQGVVALNGSVVKKQHLESKERQTNVNKEKKYTKT